MYIIDLYIFKLRLVICVCVCMCMGICVFGYVFVGGDCMYMYSTVLSSVQFFRHLDDSRCL